LRPRSWAALALLVAGATLANVAEEHLLSATERAPSAAGARLSGGSVRAHSGGAELYRAEFRAMTLREGGRVDLEGPSGKVAAGEGSMAFSADRGSAAASGAKLALQGDVRLALPGGGASPGLVRAERADLRLDSGGVSAGGGVRIDIGDQRADARFLLWEPGGPLQLEEVRAIIP